MKIIDEFHEWESKLPEDSELTKQTMLCRYVVFLERKIDGFAEANANTVLGDVDAEDLKCCGNCKRYPVDIKCMIAHRYSWTTCINWIYDDKKFNQRHI